MADNTTVFNAADDYERFMGRWSRAIGEKFLGWLGAPPNARWLDVGCGTGAFSELIAKRLRAGIDHRHRSLARADRVRAGACCPVIAFEVGRRGRDAVWRRSFDVVASALVLHFIPDRAKAFAEMKRVLAPGGLVGGYTWKREGMQEFAAYAPMLDGLAAIGGGAAAHGAGRGELGRRHARLADGGGLHGCGGDRDRGDADLRELRRVLGDADDPVLARSGKAVQALTMRSARGCAMCCARRWSRGRHDHVSGAGDRRTRAQAVALASLRGA